MPSTVNDTSDIQEFRFTHLEMAVIATAVHMFRSKYVDLHTLGHLTTGHCHKGEAAIIDTANTVLSVLNDKTVPERINDIHRDVAAGKYM